LKGYLGKVATIIWKDVVSELRTKEMFSSMLVFALLVTVIFSFAVDPRAVDMRELAPGLLWVAFSFSGILGLNRSFALEKARNSLEGLMLTPVDRSGIYLAKMLGNFVFLSVVELVVLPLFWVLYNLTAFPLALALVVPLGTLGFVAAGTLFAAMTVNTRAREVMLPMLLLPVSVPVIVASVKSTAALMTGDTLADIAGWLQLMVACDVVFIVLAVLIFEYVIEE
jgi:heme exporter protein B